MITVPIKLVKGIAKFLGRKCLAPVAEEALEFAAKNVDVCEDAAKCAARTVADCANATVDLTALAEEIQTAGGMPRSAQTVTINESTDGRLLATGGARDLTDAQKAFCQSKGILVADDLPGFHAEITAMSHVGDHGFVPSHGVTTNRICNTGLCHCEGQLHELAECGGL